MTSYGKLELLICLHFPMGSNRNKQRGRVPLMWLTALSSGLAVLWCGCMVLWRNPLRLKKI